MSGEAESVGLIGRAGPWGMLFLAVGLFLLMAGFVLSAMRVPRWTAAILGVPVLALAVTAGVRGVLNMTETYEEVVKLGPAVTPRDLEAGVSSSGAVLVCGAIGFVAGLAGVVAVLVRRNPPAPDDETACDETD